MCFFVISADRLKHTDLLADGGNVLARTHDVLNVDEQAAAEGSARMAAREVLLREALGGEGRNGERVAEGERCGRGRGRRQIERAGFAADVAVEMHIGVLGEAGVRVARDGDERRALALERGDDGEKLVGFAGVRDGEHDVVGRDHAEVAVGGFSGMDEVGGGARGGKGGGELAADVAGLAHAGHDQTALAGKNARNGVREFAAERRGEVRERPGFLGQNFLPELESCCGHRMHECCSFDGPSLREKKLYNLLMITRGMTLRGFGKRQNPAGKRRGFEA